MGANLQQSPPITYKQDPKILEHLHFLTRSVPSNLFQLRIKASDSGADSHCKGTSLLIIVVS